MSTLRVQLAYAPRGVGLAYAVVYLEKDPDICEWWIGAIGADKFDPVASDAVIAALHVNSTCLVRGRQNAP